MRRRRRSCDARGASSKMTSSAKTMKALSLPGIAWRIPTRMAVLLLFCLGIRLTDAVECYCTDDHCVPYGSCEGNACLVGILKESNQVIRTCGNHKLGCFRDVDDKWADLCVCADRLCNTFSFLRKNTQKEKPHTFLQPPSIPIEPVEDQRGNGYFKQHPNDFHDDDDHLVFHRMDRPDDGPVHNPDAPLATSFVTILLVVVPLTVGALTVVIVAFNYYCHLC